MRILAIDLGTHFGWARGDTLGIPFTGHEQLPDDDTRYREFYKFLNNFKAAGIDVVAFEDIKFAQSSLMASRAYGGFLAILKLWATTNDVQHIGYGATTIKMFATGSGAASKKMMMKAAMMDGFKLMDDNEADAYWILRLAIEELSK